MKILIFTGLYLLSAFLSWRYFTKAYGPKGKWRTLDTDFLDIVFVFFPVLNTSFALTSWLFIDWRHHEYSKKRNFNKFFKIK